MTKDELKEQINSMHEGDLGMLKHKLNNIVESVFDKIAETDDKLATAFVKGGTGTAAEIAALVSPVANALYRVVTTGGNLNSGGDQITVAVRDIVYHNGTKWVLFADADA